MNKSTFFTGQPILAQLIKYIDRSTVERISKEEKSDHYCKKFKTWQHLTTMLYTVYQHCNSLREVSTGMLACEGRLQSIGHTHFVRRSTLSDANIRRSSTVFEKIFNATYNKLSPLLPDSHLKGSVFKKLYIIDSTTIGLFQEILKAAGREPSNGKRKGGVKIHMAVKATEDVPGLVMISSSASHDGTFLSKIKSPPGSYIVFDKGITALGNFIYGISKKLIG